MQISEAMLATLFPVSCQVCGRLVETIAGGIACEACWKNIIALSLSEGCRQCCYPLPALVDSADRALRGCARCRGLQFNCARACGRYEGALRAAILQLKTRPFLCQKLAYLLQSIFESDEALQSSDVILPVPLHERRLRRRGFNQAEIIADNLSARVGVPLDAASLARAKDTAMHRAGMDGIDRSSSLSGAFRVVRPRLINGACILLVDDLFTTGSTLSACSEALLSAGATQVNVLTIARVVS